MRKKSTVESKCPRRSSSSRTSRSPSAARRCSTAPSCRCRPASGSAWSAATAPANRRCSRSPPALIEPDRGTRLRAAGRHRALSAAGAGFRRRRDHARLCRSRPRAAATIRIAARYLLEQLGLDGSEDPAHLSGGEARRAALARVLAPAPDILLLDEPTNHLDLPTIEWLERELDGRRCRAGDDQPRPPLPRQPVARHGLARPRRRRAAIERGFADFESLARRGAGGGGAQPAQARPQDRRRGALAALRRHRRGASATCGGSATLHSAARDAPHLSRRRRQARRITASRGRPVRQAGDRGQEHRQVLRRPRRSSRDFSTRILRGDRIGIVGPNGSGKTTLINLLHRRARARQRHACGSAPTSPIGHARPASRQPRSRRHRGRGADRRPRRHRHGRRPGAARHRLHEGFPVRARAGAHAARRAVRRRARPADAGAGAGQAVEPAGARRADQRSRSRNARRAGGDARRLCRHRPARQPRPRLPRPRGQRA